MLWAYFLDYRGNVCAPLTNIGYFDPLNTPGFTVGVSFVILFFGAGGRGLVVGRRPTAAFGRVSISLAWGAVNLVLYPCPPY
jgi:hypothetical protein